MTLRRAAQMLCQACRYIRRMVDRRRARRDWGKTEGMTPAEIAAERQRLAQEYAKAKRGHRERGTLERKMRALTIEGLQKE
jgi:hypothetical protein